MLGVDYSSGVPSPQSLKAAGVKFIARYISTPGNPKNITFIEEKAMFKVGIKVVTVFETTANRPLNGAKAGVVDARSAAAQLASLGAPADAPVYFAADFDAFPQQQAAINAYLAGAASVLGHDRVGVYGGYYVVKRALDKNACKYAWQTIAWSGGQWDPRAHIRQNGSGHVGGVSVDFDRSQQDDFGQWFAPHRKPAPKPRPVPAPKPKPVDVVVPFPKDDSFWTWLRWKTATGEFAEYGRSNKDVRPNVPQRIPAQWWASLKFFLSKNPSEV